MTPPPPVAVALQRVTHTWSFIICHYWFVQVLQVNFRPKYSQRYLNTVVYSWGRRTRIQAVPCPFGTWKLCWNLQVRLIILNVYMKEQCCPLYLYEKCPHMLKQKNEQTLASVTFQEKNDPKLVRMIYLFFSYPQTNMHILWNKTEAKCESFKPNSGFRICFWVSGSHPSFLLSQSLRFVYPSSGQRHNKKHRQWLTMPTNWASQTTPPSAIMYSCKQEEIVLALLISWSEMEKKEKKEKRNAQIKLSYCRLVYICLWVSSTQPIYQCLDDV